MLVAGFLVSVVHYRSTDMLVFVVQPDLAGVFLSFKFCVM